MEQKQKDLLLKDICSRLPYGVKVHVQSWDQREKEQFEDVVTIQSIDRDGYIKTSNEDYESFNLEEVKPYLFPLSSMTEEQYYEMQNISGKDCLEHMEVEKEWRNNIPFHHLPLYQHKVIEFFHKHHFDYRGLIPMGLAIDATNLNIY